MDEQERAVIEAAKAFVLERGLTSVRGRGDMFDRLCDAVDALNLSAQAEVREVEAKRLPTIEEIGGSDPNFTGDLSSEEYVRRMRDGEPAVEVGHGETPPEGYDSGWHISLPIASQTVTQPTTYSSSFSTADPPRVICRHCGGVNGRHTTACGQW